MTSDLDLRAIADRLKQALEGSAMSIGELSERLKPLGVESSTSSLQRYVAGISEPSGRWVAAAAPILEVRVEWLLSGEEPMATFPLTRAGLHRAQSRMIDQLMSVAPAEFAMADRLRFGELVRRAMRSLALEKAQARALVLEMLAAPLAAAAARLKPPAVKTSDEECLRTFVTLGQLAPEFFEVANKREYVTFALQAAARAIPADPPGTVASMRALARAAKARKSRKPRTSK